MNAKQQVINALKTAYESGEVNAMEVFKGYAVDTGLSGWHFRKFGRSSHVFLGTSVTEAQETIQEIVDSRHQ